MTIAPWIPADWTAPAGVVAGCTTRQGGVSEGRYATLNIGEHVGDAAERVTENRRRFVASCALPQEPGWLSQVHAAAVVVDPAPGTEADAAVSHRAGFVCAVMVADCLPVLFCSKDGTRIAAAHAGWRGLAAGVLENTVAALDTAPSALQAWLGPAISQAAFEVGDEVREAFVGQKQAAERHFRPNARGRWQANLYGLARQRLADAGVESVSGGDFCTFADADRFFSHRRDGVTGRMAGFIFRR